MNKRRVIKNLAIIGSSLLVAGGITIGAFSCKPVGLLNYEIDPTVYSDVYSYEVENWNPVITQTSQDITEILNVQESLLYSDHFGDYQGGLAKDKNNKGWEFSPDGRTLTIYLRDGTGARDGSESQDTDDIVPYQWTNQKGETQSETPTIKRYDVDDNYISDDNIHGQVLPHHIYNSLRYALNPFNGAEGLYMWENTSDVISEIAEYVNALNEEGKFDAPTINESAAKADVIVAKCMAGNIADLPSVEGINLNDFTNNNIFDYNDGTKNSDGFYTGGWIKFHFSRPAQMFAESLLGASPFCATPDIAINYENPIGGPGYGMSPDVMWYDGAYLLTKNKMSFARVYEFNKHWRTKFDKNGNIEARVNEPSIKKIIKNYSGTAGIDYKRRLFEHHDVSGAGISPSDIQGWNKYIGDDMNNPKFQGANVREKPVVSSWGITTNFFHQQITGDSWDKGRTNYNGKTYNEDDKEQWKIDNYATALPSVRAFVAFLFNRSYIAHYYGESLDPKNFNADKDPAFCLRNNYTPYGLASDDSDKDYVDYVTDEAKEKIQDINTNVGLDFDADLYANKETNDSTEGFRYDPYIGLSAWSGVYTSDSAQAYIQATKDGNRQGQINALEAKIREDFKTINPSFENKTANFYWLQNGDYKNSSGKPVADAIAEFNKEAGGVDNTPVRIIPYNSIDSNDYKSLRNTNHFTYIISGWSPDYADPYNFLNLFMQGGYIAENYAHFGELFEWDGNNLVIKDVDGLELAETQKAYGNLRTSVEDYSKEMVNISTSSDLTIEQKFAAYAEQEYKSNHLAPICEPLYVDPTKSVLLSYVDPDSLSYGPDQTTYSSTSTGRIQNMSLDKKLLKQNEYQGRVFMNKFASLNVQDQNAYNSLKESDWKSNWGDAPTFEQCKGFVELPKNIRGNDWAL